MKKVIAFILKVIIIISSIIGVVLSMSATTDAFMGGISALLYFTIQSNIWIGTVCLIFLIIKLISIITHKSMIKKWMYVVKYVFTISITLTGLVFCFVLAPVMAKDAWNVTNILTHVVVPLAAIIDLMLDIPNFKYNNKHLLLSTLPPIYYLIFAIICFVSNVNFPGNTNYPYFFLNFTSPAGIFGFSNVAPYFMGSFYWILVMVLIVLGFAYVYKLVCNKLLERKK